MLSAVVSSLRPFSESASVAFHQDNTLRSWSRAAQVTVCVNQNRDLAGWAGKVRTMPSSMSPPKLDMLLQAAGGFFGHDSVAIARPNAVLTRELVQQIEPLAKSGKLWAAAVPAWRPMEFGRDRHRIVLWQTEDYGAIVACSRVWALLRTKCPPELPWTEQLAGLVELLRTLLPAGALVRLDGQLLVVPNSATAPEALVP